MKKGKARSYAERLYGNLTFSTNERGFYDLDGDGKVSREEFASLFSAWVATERAIAKEEETLPRPDMSLGTNGASGEL